MRKQLCTTLSAVGILIGSFSFAQTKNAWVSSLYFAPGGKQFISTSYDSSIRVWNIGESKPGRVIPTAKLVMKSALSNDGHYLFVQSDESSSQVWDLQQQTSRQGPQIAADNKLSAAFTKDSKSIVYFDYNDSTKKLSVSTVEVATGKMLALKNLLRVDHFIINAAADGFVVISGNTVGIYKLNMSELDVASRITTDSVTSIALSNDGKHVAIADRKSLRIYDVRRSKAIYEAATGASLLRTVVFSPQGDVLGISYNGDVILHDIKSEEIKWTGGNVGPQDYGWIARPVFNGNGDRLAISYDKNNIVVYDTKSGKLLKSIKGDTHLLLPVFDAEATSLLTSQGYNGIAIWPLNSDSQPTKYAY